MQEFKKRQIDYRKCSAKTYETKNGKKVGSSFEIHCNFVGTVAKELINKYSKKIQSSLSIENPFPCSPARAASAEVLNDKSLV